MTVAQFSQFYFSTGWMLMCGVGVLVGFYAGAKRRNDVIALYLVIAIAVGVVAVYGA